MSAPLLSAAAPPSGTGRPTFPPQRAQTVTPPVGL